MKIAMICTTHNRMDKTRCCLNSIKNQRNAHSVSYDIYICDDNSTDGTFEMIQNEYKHVYLCQGNGELFWTRGMAKAIESVSCIDSYDAFLMINDDVEFDLEMLDVMYENFVKHSKESPVCIVGPTRSKIDGTWTYGGHKLLKNRSKEKMNPVDPSDKDLQCQVAGWNCFLLPISIYEAVGQLDTAYEHAMGDFDYCRRMCKEGYKIYSADAYIGFCESNPIENTWRDTNLSLRERLVKLEKKTGLPWKSRAHYDFKYFGLIWGLRRFLQPYITIFRDSLLRYKNEGKI